MLLNPTHCSFKHFKPSQQARAGQTAGEVWVGNTHVPHHHRNNDSTQQSALKVIITLQDHLRCKPQCFNRGTCIKMEHIQKGSEQNKRPIFHAICTTKFGYWVTFLPVWRHVERNAPCPESRPCTLLSAGTIQLIKQPCVCVRKTSWLPCS